MQRVLLTLLLLLALTSVGARNRVVTNRDRGWEAERGLDDRCIALWPSHGLYYNGERDRWMWQRAPVMTTVEDKLTLGYVLNYLLPMLENAGAEVYIPRERDPQPNEVIIEKYVGQTFKARSKPKQSIVWRPDIPESGWYSVTIYYPEDKRAVRDARFVVHHAAGETSFEVDEQRGFGSWIYLGTFFFEQGESDAVVMTDESDEGGVVVAPKVRFGGGIGASGERRVWECAREYLRWAGAPYDIYSPQNQDNNYRDDIRCRPLWVNWIAGGTKYNPRQEGANIPVEMALAFHTDAGCRLNRIVGTMSIYSSTGYDSRGKLTKYLPSGINRRTNRTLAQAVHQEIMKDVRLTHCAEWPSRGLVDKHYNEVTYECVPSMLLELFSHQNYQDMLYGLDPRFRFTVCRAVYKGVLRYLAGPDAVVQPLPVHAMSALLEGDSVRLQWQPTVDTLEPTAVAEKYIVYKRTGRSGWDNGIVVDTNVVRIALPEGSVVSFRVSALNRGGRSMEGEAVSVCRAAMPKGEALVVNCFDRVSGPEGIFNPPLVGFPDWTDRGVGEGLIWDYIGPQTDFTFGSKWISDDAAGWGHSRNDCQFNLAVGNNHDLVVEHAIALAVAGYSVSSCAKDVFTVDTALHCYALTDLLFGAQRTTRTMPGDVSFRAFPDELITAMENVVSGGNNLLITGQYVATDPFRDSLYTDSARLRLSKIFGAEWRASDAARMGIVRTTGRDKIVWNTEPNPQIPSAVKVDAFEPLGLSSHVAMRYWQNGLPAAVVNCLPNATVLTVGFPLECVLHIDDKVQIINILNK